MSWIFEAGGQKRSGTRAMVMAILNLTPDSFHDGGRHCVLETALTQARLWVAQGAAILDLGGESTRPGAQKVSAQQEMDRVLPVLEALIREFGPDLWISIDTMKASVAEAALKLGAQIINDVSALEADPLMEPLIQKYRCSVVLNHMQGTPQTMQMSPTYEDVLHEVVDNLGQKAQRLVQSGLNPTQICLDPGIGFGKTLAHNQALLSGLKDLAHAGEGHWPLLVGLSRKSMLGAIPGLEDSDRLMPSVAGALWCSAQGAAIVRVHDVRETEEALRTWDFIHGGSGYGPINSGQ